MTEVLWEDQQKINEFSKLNGKLSLAQESLEDYKKEKEYLDDVSMELELVDEDDKIDYKVGEVFVSLRQEEVMERLEKEKIVLDESIEKTEGAIDEIEGRMSNLKTALYAKFGKSINLDK